MRPEYEHNPWWRKDKNCYLSEEAELTLLLGMTQSLKTVIGWLSKKNIKEHF